jgi:hypothetical protein
MALGGGFPQGRIIEVYGQKDSWFCRFASWNFGGGINWCFDCRDFDTLLFVKNFVIISVFK